MLIDIKIPARYNLSKNNVIISRSISYPIVPYALAFLQSHLLLVTAVNGIDPKRHIYFYSENL